MPIAIDEAGQHTPPSPDKPPERYALRIAYRGGAFAGWQAQRQSLTVQSVLEDAARQLQPRAIVHGAGRTDAGVHAWGQVAHLDMDKPWPEVQLCCALNAHVRALHGHAVAEAVVVLEAVPVPHDFHARFSAIQRVYQYRLLNRSTPCPLRAGLVWHTPRPLDIPAMHTAAQTLVGHHDFSAFRAQGCNAPSPLKTIDALDVLDCGDEIHIQCRARSFLYRMVRNMVGSLVLVGQGRRSSRWIQDTLAEKNRASAGPTAPAHGLCLMEVRYQNPLFKGCHPPSEVLDTISHRGVEQPGSSSGS